MPRKLHPALAQRAELTRQYHGHLATNHKGFGALNFGQRGKLIQQHVTKHLAGKGVLNTKGGRK